MLLFRCLARGNSVYVEMSEEEDLLVWFIVVRLRLVGRIPDDVPRLAEYIY